MTKGHTVRYLHMIAVVASELGLALGRVHGVECEIVEGRECELPMGRTNGLAQLASESRRS